MSTFGESDGTYGSPGDAPDRHGGRGTWRWCSACWSPLRYRSRSRTGLGTTTADRR